MSRRRRIDELKELEDKEFRDEFLSSAVRLGIAVQTQAIREKLQMTQAEFAAAVGKKQTQISRLESGESGANVQTLVEIASALGIGLTVRFSDYDQVLDQISDMSNAALLVKTVKDSVAAATRPMRPPGMGYLAIDVTAAGNVTDVFAIGEQPWTTVQLSSTHSSVDAPRTIGTSTPITVLGELVPSTSH